MDITESSGDNGDGDNIEVDLKSEEPCESEETSI